MKYVILGFVAKCNTWLLLPNEILGFCCQMKYLVFVAKWNTWLLLPNENNWLLLPNENNWLLLPNENNCFLVPNENTWFYTKWNIGFVGKWKYLFKFVTESFKTKELV